MADTDELLRRMEIKMDNGYEKVGSRIDELQEHFYQVDKKIDLERQKTHDYLQQKQDTRENTEKLIQIVSKDTTMGIANSQWATILYSIAIVLVGILGVLF